MRATSKPSAKRSYSVAREGFVLSTYRVVGEPVSLRPEQARYLILAGQLEDPDRKPTVKEQALAAIAASGASSIAEVHCPIAEETA